MYMPAYTVTTYVIYIYICLVSKAYKFELQYIDIKMNDVNKKMNAVVQIHNNLLTLN